MMSAFISIWFFDLFLLLDANYMLSFQITFYPLFFRLVVDTSRWQTYENAAQIKCRFFQRTELGGTWLATGQATKFPICNSALFPDRLARRRIRARANVMEML